MKSNIWGDNWCAVAKIGFSSKPNHVLLVQITIQVFKECFITNYFLFLCLQVTLPENDSQNNSGLSRSNLKSYRASLTVKEIADIDGVLKDCGLPTCDSFPLTSESFAKALDLSWRHQTEKLPPLDVTKCNTWRLDYLFAMNDKNSQQRFTFFGLMWPIFCYLSYPILELSIPCNKRRFSVTIYVKQWVIKSNTKVWQKLL